MAFCKTKFVKARTCLVGEHCLFDTFASHCKAKGSAQLVHAGQIKFLSADNKSEGLCCRTEKHLVCRLHVGQVCDICPPMLHIGCSDVKFIRWVVIFLLFPACLDKHCEVRQSGLTLCDLYKCVLRTAG